MKKYFLSFLLLGIYFVTIILPYVLTTMWHTMDSKDPLFLLHLGIFHIPSLVFIGASAILLHMFIHSKVEGVKKSHKKAKKELREAIDILSLDNKNRLEDLSKSENTFCKDIYTVVTHGGIEEDLELVVNKQVSHITAIYEKLINEYSFIVTILPMLGMVGTVTGLLQMFAITDGVDNFAEKFASLSVALATTLYATLWVILITKPKSKDIENYLMEIDYDERLLIINSKLFLHNTDIYELPESEEVDVLTKKSEVLAKEVDIKENQ